MNVNSFRQLLEPIVAVARERPLDDTLMDDLNARIPAHSEVFRVVEAACHAAIEAGWMCSREAGGIGFGRVIKAGPETASFSVDVVSMKDVVGPHHRHPEGEIDMIMPVDKSARFDGHGAGWLVYGPDSAHHPTVAGGRALVLYLLPNGAIEFTRR
jgi:hypothetical protein